MARSGNNGAVPDKCCPNGNSFEIMAVLREKWPHGTACTRTDGTPCIAGRASFLVSQRYRKLLLSILNTLPVFLLRWEIQIYMRRKFFSVMLPVS
jgi:hypothetical protein